MATKPVSEAKWLQMKGKIKEKWGELTDNDIEMINGRIDQLSGKIQEKYSIKSGEVEKDVREWWDQHFQKDMGKRSSVKVTSSPRTRSNRESLFKKLQHL
jgi:uncharacterized protein YjbJ (UPF0337 family)